VFHDCENIRFAPQVNTERTAQMIYYQAMKICDRLKIAREKAGFELPSDAARHFGWSEHTYKSHENGARGVRLDVAKKYAAAFRVSVSWLTTGDETPLRDSETSVQFVPVYGQAAGGVWLENEDDTNDEGFVPVSPDPRYPAHAQYARLVKGSSVSNRIQSAEYAIVVRFDAYPGAVPDGTLVDVERIRAGLREHTIKVFRSGKLYTDDAGRETQTELNISNGECDTEVRIAGVVIGAFRPL
jgi:DNA-binding XRE family transcriptional regulator